ncbi:MAG: hypothetical protein RLZZ568_1455 [Cyanobacteriota bacterium]|jgi:type I restriction enzyme M protein
MTEASSSCNLHTVLDCPAKTFLGTGAKTIVLIFEKGNPRKGFGFISLIRGNHQGKRIPSLIKNPNALKADSLREPE